MIGRVNKFILSNFEESQYIEMSKTVKLNNLERIHC